MRALGIVVDDGEMKQGEMGRKASEYDTLMERFMELQQVRANLENELSPLREERAGILRESAVLREGAQPEKYARLKQEYASLGVQCEQLQETLQHEKGLVQRHLDTNVQLEQKLKEATNPDKLQSVYVRGWRGIDRSVTTRLWSRRYKHYRTLSICWSNNQYTKVVRLRAWTTPHLISVAILAAIVCLLEIHHVGQNRRLWRF